jgi:hypothetical protein
MNAKGLTLNLKRRKTWVRGYRLKGGHMVAGLYNTRYYSRFGEIVVYRRNYGHIYKVDSL